MRGRALNNWEKHFGTADRTAETLAAAAALCDELAPACHMCPLGLAPLCLGSKRGSAAEDDMAAWLRQATRNHRQQVCKRCANAVEAQCTGTQEESRVHAANPRTAAKHLGKEEVIL